MKLWPTLCGIHVLSVCSDYKHVLKCSAAFVLPVVFNVFGLSVSGNSHIHSCHLCVQIQNQMASVNISPAGYPANPGTAVSADPYRLNWGSPQPTQPYQMSANVNH